MTTLINQKTNRLHWRDLQKAVEMCHEKINVSHVEYRDWVIRWRDLYNMLSRDIRYVKNLRKSNDQELMAFAQKDHHEMRKAARTMMKTRMHYKAQRRALFEPFAEEEAA